MRSLRSRGEEEEWTVCMVLGFALAFMVLLGILLHFSLEEDKTIIHEELVGIYGASKSVSETGSEELVFSKGNYAPAARKLLTSNTTSEDYGGDQGDGGDDNNNGDGSPNRIGMGSGAPCSKDSILVFQGATSPLPNGIPTYTVEIQNVCLSESCSISGIHLSCGWFSSARLIDPSVFRRINYDDCLVNDGQPLNPGEALSFQYANTFKYPLSVSSVSC